MQSFAEFVKENKNNPKRSIVVEANDKEVLARSLLQISEKRSALEKEKTTWNEKKKSLSNGIKYHVEQMNIRLGKLESGLNYTADIQLELDGIKEIFEDISEGDKDIKYKMDMIDEEEEDIKLEISRLKS